MVINFHNVNQIEDHIRIYSHSAKFFIGKFDRFRSHATLTGSTLENIQRHAGLR